MASFRVPQSVKQALLSPTSTESKIHYPDFPRGVDILTSASGIARNPNLNAFTERDYDGNAAEGLLSEGLQKHAESVGSERHRDVTGRLRCDAGKSFQLEVDTQSIESNIEGSPNLSSSSEFTYNSNWAEELLLEGLRRRAMSVDAVRQCDVIRRWNCESEKTFKLECRPVADSTLQSGLTYSELLAKAISSSPEQRLTLQGIYRWFEENVEGISNGSISNHDWKNTVRHTLSMRKRFVRVAMTSKGNKSWWTVKPCLMQKSNDKPTKPKTCIKRSHSETL
ncbi:predicted protein [Nematostella vectensis]|uniref:Fork-head domain-containing protein n=1 Tax=Nematostella vectensis TaxID=45351 RepID=A7SL43_NEMVE|nr:fork head domain transcription factor slp1 [Nematostella vectensis]EDO35579.1 predicted protein [Nematostella vectensis]|eukprot:XP_001627679.1 predicted protein [Nematostella vectensis]